MNRSWRWSVIGVLAAVAITSPPPAQVPTFFVNAATLGLFWGMLRLLSGSVVVTSVSHGVWNGLAYVLFGFGSHVGVLGITNTALYGPEIGILGLLLNVTVAAALFAWCRHKRMFA